MHSKSATPFAEQLSDFLGANAMDLAEAWLDKLRQRLPEHPQRIFPEATLLNHIPMLLRRVGHAIAFGEEILETHFIHREMGRLVRLRRLQGYGPEELTIEVQILADLTFDFIERGAKEIVARSDPVEVMQAIQRLRRALDRLVGITIEVHRKEATSVQIQRAEIMREFGNAVTHELRNRLNTVVLAAHAVRQLCAVGRDLHKLEPVLDRLDRAVRRTSDVVDDVFAVAVAPIGSDALSDSPQSLAKIVADVCEDMHAIAQEAGVDLEVEGTIPSVQVEPVHMRILLMNLVSNGIKYNDSAKSPRFVRIAATALEPDRWRLDVADNGLGIDASLRAKVFDRYVRGTTEDRVQGQGLGLYIAQLAAEKLGGTLDLHSESGTGTTFSLVFRGPARELERREGD